jgi:hypothetical protein
MDHQEDNSQYSNMKGVRREQQQKRAARNMPRKGRGRRRRDYQVVVRSELRKEPDLRKIARAVIQMALAEANAEKAAQTEQRGNAEKAAQTEQRGNANTNTKADPTGDAQVSGSGDLS